MRQSRLWIEIAAIVIVAVAAFFVGRVFPSATPFGSQAQAPVGPENSSPTREDVPPGTVVPATSSTGLAPGVAQPQIVKKSGGESSPYLRSFSVTVKDGVVSPNNIVSYVGDILTITFESGDRAYDFVQPDHGLSWQVPAGGSKTLQFQASGSGKFVFYCPSCGGPDAGPKGYFTVVPS
jgi:heme/copper-type cytochrome/quinol oxidase subunit 2